MRRRRHISKLIAEINIAPFTDVILVLLIVFMVTTPMILRSSIKIALPKVSNNQQTSEIKDKDINVSITSAGEVYLDNERYNLKLDFDLFKFKLKHIMNAYNDPAIIINGDRNVKYDYVVQVIDAASKLGIKHLVLATEIKTLRKDFFMPVLGTSERPLRVAIVGSGPSGFYTAEDIFKQNLNVKVDMFDKLPVPFGLVRYGVAPDHLKIKNVTKVFEKTAGNPRFSFFGNVTVGKNINVFELNRFYDAVVFAYGAESDRQLGINGEDLVGSYTATEFVAWYNGHPDFQDHHFDFSHEVAVIVGNGNVAMDVARILCKTPEELKGTDITQSALDVLAESRIKEVHVYGRRGPVQASFTAPEIREMGELADCYPVINPKDLELIESSQKELEDPANAGRKKNYEIMQHFLSIGPNGRKRKFVLHFGRSPVEIIGKGRVQKAKFEINKMTGEPNKQKVRGTGKFEEIDCGVFFRSVGYTGIPIKGLPFSAQAGIVPNQSGRVMDSEQIFTGWYVAGWIKRGATGVIGTNKPDAEDTVKSLLEDIEHLNPCEIPSSEELIKFLKDREVRVVTFEDWKKIDAAEIQRGVKLGKPREKFTRVTGMLSAV